jgi:hypothetical protein
MIGYESRYLLCIRKETREVVFKIRINNKRKHEKRQLIACERSLITSEEKQRGRNKEIWNGKKRDV